MKIIKKIEIIDTGTNLFELQNNSYEQYQTCIVRADIITGTLLATSVLKDWLGNPSSRIIYEPYFSRNSDGTLYIEPDETDDEHNFRVQPNKPSDEYTTEERENGYRPITIPDGTKSIHVLVAPRDYVYIWGLVRERYLMVDDDGNEISA